MNTYAKGGIIMNDKKYDNNGYLIVCEVDSCPLWEKDTIPCMTGWDRDCFFCRYSDFRTPEFVHFAEKQPRHQKLYSICHNEFNRK